MYEKDTIAAISTGVGEGAIGIVRMSGPDALPIIQRIFLRPGKQDQPLENFRIHHGFIIDPETLSRLDEVLVSVMRAPKTYTREDIVEINCHGGYMAQRKVLELLIKEGARLAEPGEFTKRAFLNGRIDLLEAEAVLGLVKARSEEALKIAARQCSGTVSREINEIREDIIEALSGVEAFLDFIEEDLGELDEKHSIRLLVEAHEKIKELIEGEHLGSIYRHGVEAAIVGKTNVGKSSLLNALLREEKALVTEIPGTTRDAVEGQITISGIPFILVDTAGIRRTGDRVEVLGVEKSKIKVRDAHFVLVVLDASMGLDDQDREIIELTKGKRRIILLNKVDLGDLIMPEDVPARGAPLMKVSAKTGEGLRALEEEMASLIIREDALSSGDAVIMNLRQRSHLIEAGKALGEALRTIDEGGKEEIVALLLRESLDHLDSITGKRYQEDLLDSIFSMFCIGK